MYLVVAATEMEIAPVREMCGDNREDIAYLICGIGPVEAALHSTRYLATHGSEIDGVVHCGVAGAYVGTSLSLLDTILVNEEVLAELGISTEDTIEDFDNVTFNIKRVITLDNFLFSRVSDILAQHKIQFITGRMLTVSCVSGTEKRGHYLRDRYQAIGENMEGAAVARACEEFGIDCVEIRSISNLVEDRDLTRWRLTEACAKNGRVVAGLLEGLVGGQEGAGVIEEKND